MGDSEQLHELCDCDCGALNPLALAFVGDAVYDLFVREQLIVQHSGAPVGRLNGMKVERVRCGAQAESVKKLLPHLTEKELMVYKRGRNAHPYHMPRNASCEDYHCATGFEALVGYIYLNKDIARLRDLFDILEKS